MMTEIIKSYQTTLLNMYLAGPLTEEQFDILAAITEHMDTDPDALELSIQLTLQGLEDKDIVDCILAKKFKTARSIFE